MNEQARLQVADEGMADVVGLRSAENHMDPCFRFPYQDLNDLFAGATVVEAMLVALCAIVKSACTLYIALHFIMSLCRPLS